MRKFSTLLLAMVVLAACTNPDKENKTGSEKVAEPAVIKPPFTDTTAAIFSQIAYCSDVQSQITRFLPRWRLVWNPQPVGGNYAFVATDGENYALAFRGTLISFTEDAFANWIYHDLNVVVQDKWSYSGNDQARIAQGAYLAWQNVERMRDRKTGKSLWSFISDSVKDGSKLVLTGHSLGGNMAIVYATYAVWKLKQANRPGVGINVITFAAPAPGNKAFAGDFDSSFPNSQRIENTNDIVPKFPCSNRIAALSDLFSPTLSARNISIGYKQISTKLSSVFTLMGTTLDLLELQSDFSGYTPTNGNGRLITIGLSGKDSTGSAATWFAEAGYQHGMAQYATAVGAPVITCQ